MKALLLWLVVQPFVDAERLDFDSFEVRERSHARLEQMGHYALPALLLATRSQDLEKKLRTKRLMDRLPARRKEMSSWWYDTTSSMEQVQLDVMAWWLFYGPDDPGCGRYLNPLNSVIVENYSSWWHEQLAKRAERWGLLPEGSPFFGYLETEYGTRWVSVIRHRAVGKSLSSVRR
jgi:hypothetical protein